MKKPKRTTKAGRRAKAAPAMLAALEAAVKQADKTLPNFNYRCTPDCQRVFNKCISAIAKARGK